MGLKPIRAFSDLTDHAKTVEASQKLYDADVDKLDLIVSGLAEAHRPYGYGFGETAFQVFIIIFIFIIIFMIMASCRLQADRFYTRDFNVRTYSHEGLRWIEKATIKSVLIRHFPELAGALGDRDNAFRAWPISASR